MIKSPSLFAQWLAAMGYNKKQVTIAGETIGLTTAEAVRRNTGEVESDLTQRLAMSAVRAGLPPWSPKVDGEIVMVAQALELVRGLVENQAKASSKIK